MSVKTAQGGYAFAGGQDTIDLLLPLVSIGVALTNQASAENFFNTDNGHIWKVDLRPFRQVRLTGRVGTVSASANSPKILLKYSTSFTTTVGSYSQLGATSVEFSMFTGATLQDSGWIDLVPGARIENCYLGLLMSGGDATADPAVSAINAQFR